MITIPIWLLIVAMLAGCSVGILAATWSAASYAKRWQTVRDCLRDDRDELRKSLLEILDQLKEREDVIAKIRRLLPPERDVTYTESTS